MMENSIERKVFDEWFNNKYVWCNTLEKAQTFLNYADFVGCVWSMGNSLLKNDYFEAYGKNTCYFVENGFLRVGDKRRYKCIKITNRLWKKFIKEVEIARKHFQLFEEQKPLKAKPIDLKIYEEVFGKKNQEETVDIMLNYIKIDRDILMSDSYDGNFSPNPNPGKEKTIEFWEAMKEIGYIESEVDFEKHVNEEIYINALNSILKENPDEAVYLELKSELSK